MSWSMPSKYPGTCKACGERYPVGEPINKGKAGWKHRDCVDLEYKPDPDYTPLPSQQAIFDWAINGTGNGLVEACPGSGKTKTLVELVFKLVEQNERVKIRVVAFNGEIASELQTLVNPDNTKVSTFHSWMWELYKKDKPKTTCSKRAKQRDMLWQLIPKCPAGASKEARKERARRYSGYKELLEKMKATELTAEECVKKYGIDLLEEEYPLADQMLKLCLMDSARADFDDMVWAPVQWQLSDKHWDWILVDECQDLNPVMLSALKNSIHPGTRVLCVGDRFQSIYAFRGSDPKMVEKLIEQFKAEVFDMPTTFRCPTSHVDFMNSFIPNCNIVAHRLDAGLLEQEKWEGLESRVSNGPGLAIVSRKKAPLVDLAFKFIGVGKAAKVMGKELGKDLIGLINQMGRQLTLPTLLEYLTNHLYKMSKTLNEQDNRNKEIIIESLNDRIKCIKKIATACDTTDELVYNIEDMFADETDAIKLWTVHKIKGKTMKEVYVLNFDEMPMKVEDRDDKQQEWNVVRVALSRSTDKLFLVGSPLDV